MMDSRRFFPTSLALVLAFTLSAASCKSVGSSATPTPPPGITVASITVTSRAFTEGSPIPVDHGCDGKDAFPGVIWSAPPPSTRSLVLIVDDPDAAGGTFTHYVAFNLPPELRALAEGVDPAKNGVRLGRNDFDAIRYNGPCPPKGEEHHYRFTVYALDTQLSAREGSSRADIDRAMNGHLLGQGTLTGRFSH
ncbi:YbhB/YbcL family Raf kinase inhibitor-like protein [Pendulispora albinea]|uniref:YbhB/YbcL family Raf kinase inhibitor-like protein n=1 Tax=Pendulispora albinea TaxID=2741071 RepID=A0ABZ2M278_9BACT